MPVLTSRGREGPPPNFPLPSSVETRQTGLGGCPTLGGLPSLSKTHGRIGAQAGHLFLPSTPHFQELGSSPLLTPATSKEQRIRPCAVPLADTGARPQEGKPGPQTETQDMSKLCLLCAFVPIKRGSVGADRLVRRFKWKKKSII